MRHELPRRPPVHHIWRVGGVWVDATSREEFAVRDVQFRKRNQIGEVVSPSVERQIRIACSGIREDSDGVGKDQIGLDPLGVNIHLPLA